MRIYVIWCHFLLLGYHMCWNFVTQWGCGVLVWKRLVLAGGAGIAGRAWGLGVGWPSARGSADCGGRGVALVTGCCGDRLPVADRAWEDSMFAAEMFYRSASVIIAFVYKNLSIQKKIDSRWGRGARWEGLGVGGLRPGGAQTAVGGGWHW